ncbi:MAG TPA: iron-sulfur cluster carrier protein ApbC [Chloroflexi bacterium]|nr:MAG: chromosome partitioning protein [Chloroflexota bacterium]HDD55605.1 iron-sulfur cluster carrier protein ApbC [Chloroflexota bacterium]
MAGEQLNQEAVLKTLGKVLDPELGKDLVTLGMIENVEVKDSVVSFTLNLTTPACPLKDEIRSSALAAVQALDGVKDVQIKMDAKVPVGQKKSEYKNIKNVIAIASGKGGVGKSTVAVNLAVTLAKKGAKVGLLDADIYGPNIPTMMGVDRLGGTTENKKILPGEGHGVKVISIGFMVRPDQALIWRGPMLHSAIKQFISDVDWGELDYLVVDLPPGTGDVQLSLSQTLELQGGLIVTLPQQVSLDDALRGINMFQELKVPIFGVVENMSYLETPNGERMDIFGSGGGEKLAQMTGVPYIGSIPIDPQVRIGGDGGMPVVLSHPDSPVSKAMVEIAEKIAGQVSIQALQG